MSDYVISLNDVCFSYDVNMVLKHLSMNVEENHICFIMGLNGAGKTTLLKTIVGFLIPQSGRITMNGMDASVIDKNTMSKLVSYVPQAIHINTDFSVIDYLSLGRTPHIGFFAKMGKDDYQVIEEYSLRLGIDSLFDVPFNKLSSGQKQIVAVTKSLIQDTPFIIMDEPMSALDIGKQVDLLKLFQELANEGKTIVLTTHNPILALTIDSDAYFLKQGSIMVYGNSQDVIHEELLREVYGKNVMLLYRNKLHFSD